jgi:hypothetical protein
MGSKNRIAKHILPIMIAERKPNQLWVEPFVGGANMIVRTPDGLRDSQGQFNLVEWAEYTMDRPGVIQFETEVLQDTLCVVGFPEATIYAKSNPSGVTSGPTDTDFFVRVVDVYPDGRELYVVEGCVNARARNYARSIVEGQEDDNAVFIYTNILDAVKEGEFEEDKNEQ